jgi:lysophospholipase L1-like esterase
MVAGAAGAVALGGLASPAARAADNRPTAVVSLGDSYISGEAGRWQGNAAPWVPGGDVYGTDRAAYDCYWDYWFCDRDPKRVYGQSYETGCDRSDVAEIQSAAIAVDRRVNLACSGAETVNVLRHADGGVSFKGQKPQADDLATVAKADKVKLVVLSIGGNDLGFSDILTQCAKDFLKPPGFAAPCNPDEEKVIRAALTATGPKVRRALASVRAAMTSAGYRDSDYRLVLQSYPAPVPVGGKYRYDESYTRESTGGCPLFNADSTWAHSSVIPRIATMLRDAAKAENAEFLDLQGAYAGHELCSSDDHQATSDNNLGNPVSSSSGEWVRFVTLLTQGYKQESLHPNAFGQRALGDCLGKLYRQPAGNYQCTNSAGQSPTSMHLTALH